MPRSVRENDSGCRTTRVTAAPVVVAGDSATLLQHGASVWHLVAFGAIAVSVGLIMWHHLGVHFGLGPARGHVEAIGMYIAAAACVSIIVLAVVVDGR